MNDVTAMPRSIVAIGGTSELAHAVLRQLVARRAERLLLTGRDQARLGALASQLRELGAPEVITRPFDVTATHDHAALVREAFARLGEVDLVLVAPGALIDGELEALSPEEVSEAIAVNFSGPAAITIGFARAMRAQGFGRIAIFSSLAGSRVRRANFVYGAAKAGLDGFAQGLGDLLHGSGVDVMIVRPGFVHTRMTAGRRPQPFAVSADAVADAVLAGLERNAKTLYVPSLLRAAAGIFPLIPRAVWRQIPS